MASTKIDWVMPKSEALEQGVEHFLTLFEKYRSFELNKKPTKTTSDVSAQTDSALMATEDELKRCREMCLALQKENEMLREQIREFNHSGDAVDTVMPSLSNVIARNPDSIVIYDNESLYFAESDYYEGYPISDAEDWSTEPPLFSSPRTESEELEPLGFQATMLLNIDPFVPDPQPDRRNLCPRLVYNSRGMTIYDDHLSEPES